MKSESLQEELRRLAQLYCLDLDMLLELPEDKCWYIVNETGTDSVFLYGNGAVVTRADEKAREKQRDEESDLVKLKRRIKLLRDEASAKERVLQTRCGHPDVVTETRRINDEWDSTAWYQIYSCCALCDLRWYGEPFK